MNVFRIRYRKLGGHVHMRMFSAAQPNFTFAKLGDLVCREDEPEDMRRAMASVEFLPEELPAPA